MKKLSQWADLALLLSEPVLLGDGGFGETVLENPLCLSFQLFFCSPLRQAGDGCGPELHPLGDVGVPDLVVELGVVAGLQLVGPEAVEDGHLGPLALLLTLGTPLLPSPSGTIVVHV